MFAPKEKPSMETLFVANAATKSEAMRVMNLALKACNADTFTETSMAEFAKVKGLGKSGLLLIAKVQIDMLKK